MKNFLKYLTNKNNSSKSRFLFLLLSDLFIILISFWISLYIRLDLNFVETLAYFQNFFIAIINIFFFQIIFLKYSPYGKFSIREISVENINVIILFSLFITLIFVIYSFFSFHNLPRSVPVIFFLINFTGFLIFRVLLKSIINNIQKDSNATETYIFGSGSYGQKIFDLLNSSTQYKIIGFIDDDISKQNKSYRGINIISRQDFIKREKKNNKIQVLIAITIFDQSKKREIENFFNKYNINISFVPSLAEISSLNLNLNQILNKIFNNKNKYLFSKDDKEFFKGKKILVTGAGGSIGSEIVRQLYKFETKEIYLVDSSEFNLFKIKSELNYFNRKYKSFLGSISDYNFMKNNLFNLDLDIIINAAAYKHVGIVEENKIIALRNNFYGNYLCCELALKSKAQNYLLISTDKAVEPLTFMGTTKRLCELQVLYYGRKNKNNTNFCSVRFGNVINSSGSVIPIFEERIRKGLHLNLTHTKMKRYFMTIEEASKLVLLTLPKKIKQKICYLNMGRQIYILDIAKKLIKLSGKKHKLIKNPSKKYSHSSNEICILVSGKQKNEKLEEKLFNKFEKKTYSNEKKIVYLESKIKVDYNIIKLAINVGKNKFNSIESFLSEIDNKKINV